MLSQQGNTEGPERRCSSPERQGGVTGTRRVGDSVSEEGALGGVCQAQCFGLRDPEGLSQNYTVKQRSAIPGSSGAKNE